MEKIIYGFFTPKGTGNYDFGEMILAQSDKGLCWLGFMVDGYKGDGYTKMIKYFPSANFIKTDIDDLGNKIINAWGQGSDLNIDLDLRGTEFQKSVWGALLKVRRGITCSYGDIANMIDNPKAVRAVGSAIGSNPVSLVVPCHRVIKKSGDIGNYGWGVNLKHRILEAEGVLQIQDITHGIKPRGFILAPNCSF